MRWALLALLVAAAPAPAARAAGERPDRVVLVVLGGGVRTKEMLDRPDLLPTVKKIGAAGFSSRGWRAGAGDRAPALEAILTGRAPAVEREPGSRAASPTLFEYARKGLALEREEAWFVSFDAAADAALARSEHADYGEAQAPSLSSGEGPFGEPLRSLFEMFGRPGPTSPRTAELLSGLRSLTARESAARTPPPPAAEAAEAERLESALLEDVDRRAATSGPNALDARAVRAALTVLRIHRPRLLVVSLGQASVAKADLFAYWEVLKRNDAAIARIRDEIASDPALRGTTLLVTADHGRDASQNAAGGYDAGDGSEDATTVAVVGEGPGLRKAASLRAPLDVRDLCPTIGRLLGFPTPHAEGRARADLVPD